MARIGLSSPWVQYYRKVNAIFKEDPEVTVVYDEENNILKLYIDNQVKADAIAELFPEEVEFGNITLPIEIVPSNNYAGCTTDDLIEDAFNGNGAISFIKNVELFGAQLTYVVFTPKIVQYYTDDLTDYYGYRSTLYADIAKELFDYLDGVYFCTDVIGGTAFGAPLGEWP